MFTVWEYYENRIIFVIIGVVTAHITTMIIPYRNVEFRDHG